MDQDLATRRRQWLRFNEWERSAPSPAREPAACVADVGTLYDWFSIESKSVDPDPEKLGIQLLRAALARLPVRR